MQISNGEEVPINVVGSSTFGRYPKISDEKTYNMYISDNWLISYAGYKKVRTISEDGKGRGIFNSVRGEFQIVVISSTVYRLDVDLNPTFIGIIETIQGDVYIDENLSSQICIVDGTNAYIYNYMNGSFTKQTLIFLGEPVLPNYVCYHNTFFLLASSPLSTNPQNWYAYEYDTPTTIKENTQFSLQTKPDHALLVERLPGRGNYVLVLGSTVGEVWSQVGGLENYRRVSSFSIDNGIVSIATLASSEKYICWLAKNENNSPVIMLTDGTDTKPLSSDGIDNLLSHIKYPEQSTAFFYRQEGHLFYHITFYNDEDNLSLFYDFDTAKFFHASNEDLDYFPARRTSFFNGNTYFISIDDGSIYNMNTDYLTYDYDVDPSNKFGEEIPRIRICNTVRKANTDRFRVGQFTFWLEQGVVPPDAPTRSRVDMSFSKNGNQSYSNVVGKELNLSGNYRNQIRWQRMGQANEFTIQLRFWGFQRFVANNGVLEIF